MVHSMVHYMVHYTARLAQADVLLLTEGGFGAALAARLGWRDLRIDRTYARRSHTGKREGGEGGKGGKGGTDGKGGTGGKGGGAPSRGEACDLEGLELEAAVAQNQWDLRVIMWPPLHGQNARAHSLPCRHRPMPHPPSVCGPCLWTLASGGLLASCAPYGARHVHRTACAPHGMCTARHVHRIMCTARHVHRSPCAGGTCGSTQRRAGCMRSTSSSLPARP